MKTSLFPLLYQLNTRVQMTDLSEKLGRTATLDDIPDSELDRLKDKGFDWVWLLSVWQTGPAGQRVSRANQEWRKEFQQTLPDLKEDDIAGSGFAITDYSVHKELGGAQALARLRERLSQRGLKLLLDFVPNHTGLDHHWVDEHPEYYVSGTDLDLSNAPQNYTRVKHAAGDLIKAHGRDPYFPGWPDTLQLDYANPQTQEAMIGELLKIAGQCDAVRCDMAMLLLPDVFERTWGRRCQPFWSEATRRVRECFPNFCFMAEVYWDLEWTLQQQGFDYTYDKRLYDRLREGHAGPVREHLRADLDYQRKMARFLENHDEPRAAATFPPEVHQAAAVITFLSPGLRFFHQGQFEGREKRISPHLVRAPNEPINHILEKFYDRLLGVLRQPLVRDGEWQLLDCAPAWTGNHSCNCCICFAWQGANEQRLLVAVNYAPDWSQCYVRLPFQGINGEQWRLQDQLGEAIYDRDGSDLLSRGLYLDVPPWQTHIFSFTKLKKSQSDSPTRDIHQVEAKAK
jgi:glycosidase